MKDSRYCPFPFSAVVGLEKAKLALLTVSVYPEIGGVLLRGDKGTGKTTLVRALANVLPEIEVVKGCPFNCNPKNPLEMCDRCYEKYKKGEALESVKVKMSVVDLPLSVTPDRLIGTIDVEKAIREGKVELRPGILAKANRNILYIDEVNLLDDYIADLILDAAAFGWNVIEREHVSFRHPSRFILIGSMNPEEGELRPQLLDRFGLVVEVRAPEDPKMRAEIVRRVEEFVQDPLGFYESYQEEEQELRRRIQRAKEIINKVKVPEDLLEFLARTLVEMRIRTCRAEIVTVRTAKAIAALEGRKKVSSEDLRRAMELALPHRKMLEPFTPPPPQPEKGGPPEEGKPEGRAEGEIKGSLDLGPLGGAEKEFPPRGKEEPEKERREKSQGSGLTGARFSYKLEINSGKGIPFSYVFPWPKPRDLDVVGTLVNFSLLRRRPEILKELLPDFLAVKVRKCRVPELDVIVVDASGSMHMLERIRIAKALAQRVVQRSYTKRASLSLISFRGKGVDVYVPATRNYDKIFAILSRLKSGGRTPLSAAMQKILEEERVFRMKYPKAKVKVYLITDGRANVSLFGGDLKEEILHFSRMFKRKNISLEIYSPKKRYFEPGLSYLDIISLVTGAKVYNKI